MFGFWLASVNLAIISIDTKSHSRRCGVGKETESVADKLILVIRCVHRIDGQGKKASAVFDLRVGRDKQFSRHESSRLPVGSCLRWPSRQKKTRSDNELRRAKQKTEHPGHVEWLDVCQAKRVAKKVVEAGYARRAKPRTRPKVSTPARTNSVRALFFRTERMITPSPHSRNAHSGQNEAEPNPACSSPTVCA